MTKIEAETFYDSIVEGEYDARLKKSLNNIKEICDEIESHGGRVYVERVGKLCKKKFGGPAAQSIRNKPGTLKCYVDLREAEQVLPAGKDRGASKIKISDPKVRAYVLQMEEELRDSYEHIGRLKKLFEQLAPVEMDAMIAQAFSNPKSSELNLRSVPGENCSDGSGTLKLGELARLALGKITSESHLTSCGFRMHSGRVLTSTNYKFLDRDELTALRELLPAEEQVFK